MNHARRLAAGSGAGALLLLALLAGCAHPPPTPQARVLPPPKLTAPYAAAAATGARVYRLDPGASRVLILVGKRGALAAFGHVHVIRVGALRGFILVTQNGTVRGDLLFPVRALAVDPPAARRQLGPPYASHQPSLDDRRGTRQNMLGPAVLDAAHYPWIHLLVTATVAQAQGETLVTAAITLHGTARTIGAPLSYDRSPQALEISGSFKLWQTWFNIVPYSAFLGALQVENAVEVRYHLGFERWRPLPANR